MKKIIFIILLFVSQLNFAQEKDTRGYKVNVGDQVPELEFTLLNGAEISTKNLKNKVTVLQFTASWCSVCIKEMPHLEKEVWQRFKNDEFLLIGVDLKEDVEKVKRFIKKTEVTYPFTIDSDGSMFEKFTLPNAGVTRNIVLDKNGKIIFLSRLYNVEEFNEMVEVIDNELKKS